jgi:cytochrome P450
MTSLCHNPQVMNQPPGRHGARPRRARPRGRQRSLGHGARPADLDAVLKETMRGAPCGPGPAPTSRREDTVVGDYDVPADRPVRARERVDRGAGPCEPDAFRAERFLDDGVDVRGAHFEQTAAVRGRAADVPGVQPRDEGDGG